MALQCADLSIAERRTHFSFPVALFVAVWLIVVVFPPMLYMPIMWDVYRDFKLELPSLTRYASAFAAWNMQFGWTWLFVPVIAGLIAPRLSPESSGALRNIERRQAWLYAAFILTLAALLIAVFQMYTIWIPWMTIMRSVSSPRSH